MPLRFADASAGSQCQTESQTGRLDQRSWSGMLALMQATAPSVGVGVGATLVGLVLILLGIAYLTDYKRVASRTHQRVITNWQKAPGFLARFFVPRVAQTPLRHIKLFNGATFVTFGI